LRSSSAPQPFPVQQGAEYFHFMGKECAFAFILLDAVRGHNEFHFN
jgi:hypothetical protein